MADEILLYKNKSQENATKAKGFRCSSSVPSYDRVRSNISTYYSLVILCIYLVFLVKGWFLISHLLG
jgi:hypothetical protein